MGKDCAGYSDSKMDVQGSRLYATEKRLERLVEAAEPIAKVAYQFKGYDDFVTVKIECSVGELRRLAMALVL